MKDMVNKLVGMEVEISEEKGGFILFALFQREDALDKWDLVVSAPWMEENKKAAMDYLVNRLRSKLVPDELLLLSRIVIIERKNPALDAMLGAIHIEHGIAEVKDSSFFGLSIKHAFIITSSRSKEEVKV